MSNVSIIGIDISKRRFQLRGATAEGAGVLRRELSRGKVLESLASQPPCLVVMEICGGAHHRGREIQQLGHDGEQGRGKRSVKRDRTNQSAPMCLRAGVSDLAPISRTPYGPAAEKGCIKRPDIRQFLAHMPPFVQRRACHQGGVQIRRGSPTLPTYTFPIYMECRSMTLSTRRVSRCRILNEATVPIGIGRTSRPPRRRVPSAMYPPSASRSGDWRAEKKARIVRESFWPGNRVSDVSQRYGLNRKQLSAWRTLARRGKLALPSSTGPEAEPVVVASEAEPEPAFATLELDPAPEPDRGSLGSVSIEARGVTVCLDGDIGAGRIAEIASVLRTLRWSSPAPD